MKRNVSDVMVRYAKFIDNYDPYLAYDANDTDMDDITFLATANTAREAYDHLEEILRDDTFDGQQLETIHAIMDDLRQALKEGKKLFVKGEKHEDLQERKTDFQRQVSCHRQGF